MFFTHTLPPTPALSFFEKALGSRRLLVCISEWRRQDGPGIPLVREVKHTTVSSTDVGSQHALISGGATGHKTLSS